MVSGTRAELSWDAVEGAGYYILKVISSEGAYIENVYGLRAVCEDLIPGEQYRFQVRARHVERGGSSFSPEVSIEVPPLPPQEISAEAGEHSMLVSWEGIEGAAGYLLIVNGSEYLIDGGNTVSREIQGLSPGTLLSCQVASRNSYGTSQDPGTAEGRTTLYPPEGVSAQAGEESITVFWDPVEGATGYEICILEQCRMVGNPAAASCTMEGLTPGEYTYTIKTRNQGGCGSAAGGSVRILPPVPEVPEQVTCMVLDDMLVIEWPAVEWAETYKVLLQWADREEIQEGSATRKVVVDPERDMDYTFFVCACNVSGCSMFSQGQTVRTSSGIPPVPAGVVGQALSATVLELQWQWDYGKAEWYEVQVNGALYRTRESRFLMEGLTPDTLYECMVQAGNRYGVSSWSRKISVRTLLPAPENISCGISHETGILEWDPVPGADYYEIDFGGSVYETAGCRLELSDLDQNTEYSYQIRGMRSDVDGEYSPMDSVRTRHLLAEQSLHVRASATRNSVLVSWDSLQDGIMPWITVWWKAIQGFISTHPQEVW